VAGGYRERQRDATADAFETYSPDAPVVFDCEFGHTYPTCPVPIGGEVEIEPTTRSIHLP
jgi:muramoyltetrapeptide carboxypeptidase LdcA involved in peptidoglycan recycling